MKKHVAPPSQKERKKLKEKTERGLTTGLFRV